MSRGYGYSLMEIGKTWLARFGNLKSLAIRIFLGFLVCSFVGSLVLSQPRSFTIHAWWLQLIEEKGKTLLKQSGCNLQRLSCQFSEHNNTTQGDWFDPLRLVVFLVSFIHDSICWSLLHIVDFTTYYQLANYKWRGLMISSIFSYPSI